MCSPLVFLDPSIDPKTLCPWCDEPLPKEPTPHLRALIKAAKRVSRPEDRLSNPLGLRAPLAAFVSVCQRHRFERNWIPRAQLSGWPTKIDFNKVPARIKQFSDALKAMTDDVDEDFASSLSKRRMTSDGTRPRKENEFWQDAVKQVRRQGSRHAVGVRGQFQQFTNTQPG